MRHHRKPLTPLQVELLRHWRKPLYHLAPIAQVHPATLAAMIKGRKPMPEVVEVRISLALIEEARKRRAGVSR